MIARAQRSALKAALWYTLSNFISKTILYLCTPLFTRVLTRSEFGQYNNFLSWQNVLLAVVAMDLFASITVAYIDYDEENDFTSFITTVTLTSVVIPLFFSIFVCIFNDFFIRFLNIPWQYLLIMLANLTLGNTLQIFQVEQRVRIEYRLSSALTLLTAVGTVLLTFVLLYQMEDKLTAVLLGNVSFNIVVSIVLLLFLLKRNFTFKWAYLKYALIFSVPLIPHTLSGAITGSSGQILITRFCGPEKTALYGLAYTISMVITMFVASVNKAWVPWFFDKLKHKEFDVINATVRQILLFLAFGTIGVCIAAPEIILIIGGVKYKEAVFLMPPILLQCFLNYIYTLYVNIEFYEKKTYFISVATIFSASAGFLLNYILLQSYDYSVVAYTFLFTGILMFAFHFMVVKWMGKIYVFENRYIMKVTLLTSAVCLFLMFAYRLSLIRLISFIFYLMFLLYFLIKNKKVLKKYYGQVFDKKQ